ncbi:hypothetical protein Tco_0528212 [Tanacetum coccineum]
MTMIRLRLQFLKPFESTVAPGIYSWSFTSTTSMETTVCVKLKLKLLRYIVKKESNYVVLALCIIMPRKDASSNLIRKEMEREVIESEMILPTHFRFKKIQMHEKYLKGQARSRQWKHLKQIIPADNYQNFPPH